jgi:hypothetical protein
VVGEDAGVPLALTIDEVCERSQECATVTEKKIKGRRVSVQGAPQHLVQENQGVGNERNSETRAGTALCQLASAKSPTSG